MKPVKRAMSLFLCLLMCLSFVGCGTRTPISEESFTAAMDKLNFTKQEVEEDVMLQSGGEGAQKLLMYLSATGGGAGYYLYSNAAYAQKQYATILSSVQQQNATKEKLVDSATYNFAKYILGETAYVLIRTDNTLLVLTDAKYMVDEILGELGY